MRGIEMDCQEILAQCGLVVRGGGRIARMTAAELMPLLNAKIDTLARRVKAYESEMGEQRAEIIRLKAELEKAEK
jgi:chaperonin cofactor prefoldin